MHSMFTEVAQSQSIEVEGGEPEGAEVRIFENTVFGVSLVQWIGLRENLQETVDFPMKYACIL